MLSIIMMITMKMMKLTMKQWCWWRCFDDEYDDDDLNACVVNCLIIYLFFLSSFVNKIFLFHLKCSFVVIRSVSALPVTTGYSTDAVYYTRYLLLWRVAKLCLKFSSSASVSAVHVCPCWVTYLWYIFLINSEELVSLFDVIWSLSHSTMSILKRCWSFWI